MEDITMLVVSTLSFAAALMWTSHTLEHWACKKVTSQLLNYLMVIAWTIFAASRGLFSP